MDVASLVTIGGREWRSSDGSEHRVYINDFQDYIRGLEVEFRDRSGRVSSATLDGNAISHNEGGHIWGALGKVWWDVNTGEWWFEVSEYAHRMRTLTVEEVQARVLEGIKDAVDQLSPERVAATAARLARLEQDEQPFTQATFRTRRSFVKSYTHAGDIDPQRQLSSQTAYWAESEDGEWEFSKGNASAWLRENGWEVTGEWEIKGKAARVHVKKIAE